MGELLSQFSDQVERFTADGAYDKTAVYDLVTARGADVVVPPTKNARLSRSSAAGARARRQGRLAGRLGAFPSETYSPRMSSVIISCGRLRVA